MVQIGNEDELASHGITVMQLDDDGFMDKYWLHKQSLN